MNLWTFIEQWFTFFYTLHDKQSCFVINSLSFLIKCLHSYQAKPHFACGLCNAIIKYVSNEDFLYEDRVKRVTISSPSLWNGPSTIS